MNKPTLTKEQAGVFEEYKRIKREGNKGLISFYLREYEGFSNYLQPLKDMGFDNFVLALYEGYTVEQTPEEKVREYYEKLEPKKHYMETQKSHCSGERFATRRVLDLLNITIKGVNDKYE